MSKQKASTGRIVRFVSHRDSDGNPVVRPAIVIQATLPETDERAEKYPEEERTDLSVLVNGTHETGDAFTEQEKSVGIAWRPSIPFSSEMKIGTWHWPARD